MQSLRTTRNIMWRHIMIASAVMIALVVGAAQASTAHAMSVGQVSAAAVSASTTASMRATCGAYVVQPGDYLSLIAQRNGVRWQNLAAANGLSNPNYIFPGERLNLCGGGASGQAPKPAVTHASTAAAVSYSTAGEPCQSPVFVAGYVSQWTVPPGCYAGVYHVNTANYVYRAGFGWCNWWPEVLHPSNPGILYGARHSQPVPGSVAVFAAGDQGASAGGHYAQVVAVLNNGWVLISEMNFYWRGAGFGLVSYRYIHQDGGVTYIYG